MRVSPENTNKKHRSNRERCSRSLIHLSSVRVITLPELAPSQRSGGCRGIVGPNPPPLLMSMDERKSSALTMFLHYNTSDRRAQESRYPRALKALSSPFGRRAGKIGDLFALRKG